MQVQQLSSKSSRVATPAHTARPSCWTRPELYIAAEPVAAPRDQKPSRSPAGTVPRGDRDGLRPLGAATSSAAMYNAYYEGSLTDLISIAPDF